MKDYWYPWAPTKFRQDTMHLSDEQELIYRRLIDFYMETGGAIPDNDQALANIARVSLEKFMPHAAVIRAFFVPGTGKATAKLQLKRCDGILADQAERKQSYAERGKKGGRKKDNENNAPKATAKLNVTTLQDTTVKEEEVVVISAREDEPPELPQQVTLSKRIGQITGWDTSPNWFGDYSRLEAWLHSGWDAELDILPTITRIVAQRKARSQDIPKTLNYFEQAVANAHATRLAPTPKGTPNENTGTIYNGRAGKHAGHAPSGPSVDEQAEALKRRYGVPGGVAAGQPGEDRAGDRHPAPVLENVETLRIEGR